MIFSFRFENINLTKQGDMPPHNGLFWRHCGLRKPTFYLVNILEGSNQLSPLLRSFPWLPLTTFTDFMALESVSTSALSPQSQGIAVSTVSAQSHPQHQYRNLNCEKKKKNECALCWYLCTQQSNEFKQWANSTLIIWDIWQLCI